LAFWDVAVSFKEKRPARATGGAGYREIVFNGQIAKNTMTFPYQSNDRGSHATSDDKIIEFINGMPLCDLLINQCANRNAQQ
jgi:hypothetical protein